MNCTVPTIKSVLEELMVEEEVIKILIEEDVTIEDLETLKKVELDELIKKYGQRRRFGRILVQWMLTRGLSIDPELLMAFGNVQSTQVICEQKNQFSLVKSSDEISLSAYSDELSSTSFTSNSSTSLLTTDFPIPLSQHSLTSEENGTENEKLRIPFEVNVEDCPDEHTAQLEADLEKVIPKLDDKILDLINVEAVEATPFEELEKNVQQLRTQPVISEEDTEDSQSKNPLFILLQKNGLRCRELVNHSQRNDLVPEWRDINLIARITAKHLLNLAIPPKRKILSSTLTRWAQYFKCLFPKTPTSCFYDFKYEPSQRRDSTVIQKKRAEGALQVQLFQERRKLIKEDRTVLLRRPSASESIGSDGSSSSSNVPHKSSSQVFITSTWRSAGLQEEGVRSEISTTDNDPELQHHLHFLCNQLHNKLTLQLAASWEATFNYRRKLLVNQSGTVWDYLNDFPFLKIDDIGKAFICKDFDQLYPNTDPIINSGELKNGKLAAILDDRRLAIIKTAKVIIQGGSQRKHKDVATSFLELAERDSDVQVRVTGVLLLLPFIFSHTFVERTWKPTRLDVVDSFIARVCSETDVKEYIEHRKSLSKTKRSVKILSSVQPYILAVGPTWENISHVYIIVDQILYTCESVIEATELCFKLFHTYHSDYPAESKHVWQLIQQGFYKLFLKDHDLQRRTITKALADIGIELNATEEMASASKKVRKV